MKSMPSSTFRRLAVGIVALLVVVSGAQGAYAQPPSLAEIARKEQERRKAQKEPTKVLTNKDLPESAQKPQAPAAKAATEPAAAGEKKPDSAAGDKPAEEAPTEERTEEWWRTRMTDAREKLRQNEMFAEALQSRVDALRRDFLNRDNPVQRARVGEEREKALAELNRVKEEVEATKKQIAAIEEEARKAGVPPGWLR
jgi:hypothetical protein